jgi:hypothetical protein
LNFKYRRYFWGEMTFIPVTTLLDTHMFNLSRSPPLFMSVEFCVDIGGALAAYTRPASRPT